GTTRTVTKISDQYYAEINKAGEKHFKLLTSPTISPPSSFSLWIPPPSIYLSPTSFRTHHLIQFDRWGRT
ncbi:hypothetical protein COW83_04615, partial [Candidatus Collierbacteria bacterium CG22_combo_CG10-13_8_21_14_all_43_12]